MLRVLLLAAVSMFLATGIPEADARAAGSVPASKSTARKPVKKKVTAKKAKRSRRKPGVQKKKRRKTVDKVENTDSRRPIP